MGDQLMKLEFLRFISYYKENNRLLYDKDTLNIVASLLNLEGNYQRTYHTDIVNYIGDNTFIGSFAFYACRLISASFINCISIENNAFALCTKLTTISFPKCSDIKEDAFAYCNKLTTISFPLCETIRDSAFAHCSNLSNLSFPKCSYIGNSAFAYCSNLSMISFPSCETIESNAFYKCTNLESIYLMSTTMTTLMSLNTFTDTLILNGLGGIYVPSSLAASYKTATNWTYYSNIIFGI